MRIDLEQGLIERQVGIFEKLVELALEGRRGPSGSSALRL